MNNTGAEVSGSLVSGSAENYRWQIVSPNVSSGVFSLVIRQGNDNSRNPSILETFTNLSLDPKSPNYVARVIGDQTIQVRGTGTDVYLQSSGSYRNSSRYVRVNKLIFKLQIILLIMEHLKINLLHQYLQLNREHLVVLKEI